MTFKLVPLRDVDLPMAAQFIEESIEWSPRSASNVVAADVLGNMNSHWRSAVSGNELFGIMGFTNISWLDKVADVCLGVVPKMRHLGVGTALAKQQNDYAFNILGLHRIQMIALADSPSCHIAAAAGLKLEGTLRQIRVKDGKRLDASVYALVKE